MQRRDFLRFSGLASAGLVLPPSISSVFAQVPSADPWRIFEVTTRVEVLKPSGATRVWLPTPLLEDTAYIKPLGNVYQAEGGTSGFTTDPKYGAGIVWAEWAAGTKPVMVMKSRFATHDVAVDFSKPGNAEPEERAELAKYTAATDLMPTDGAVKELSSSIVKDAKTDMEKARAIYDWVVDNTYRDAKVRGCGVGDVKFMVENKAWGGKCGDLNALYVALARAEGVPARDVYGVRVADSALGYKSLGKSGDISKAQHCRAEVWLTGFGWVPVDPADVRKVVLEEKAGLTLQDEVVVAARKKLFGAWEMNWLAYNFAHDLKLPGSSGAPIPFLMYPQGENAAGRLDSLDAATFVYKLSAKEIAA